MSVKTTAGLIATARQHVENLPPDQVEREMNDGVVVIDIREPEERLANGAIPGTMNAARGMIEFYADPTTPYYRQEFQTNRRLILYCASGGRSALAADTLRQMGFRNVAHLDGGMKAWREAGKPVVTST